MINHSFDDSGCVAAQDGDPSVCYGSTLTTFAALLKERYIDSDRVEELTYPENVLLGMLEKRGDTGMVGSDLPVPIITVSRASGELTKATALPASSGFQS